MASTPEPDLQSRLQAQLAHQSTRTLAERIGVSHFVVWKAANGEAVRPETRQRILDGLDHLAGGDVGEGLARIRRQLVADLGSKGAGRALEAMRTTIDAAYTQKGLPSPIARGSGGPKE